MDKKFRAILIQTPLIAAPIALGFTVSPYYWLFVPLGMAGAFFVHYAFFGVVAVGGNHVESAT